MLASLELDGNLILPAGAKAVEARVLLDSAVRGTFGCDVRIAFADGVNLRTVRPWHVSDPVIVHSFAEDAVLRSLEAVSSAAVAATLGTPLTVAAAANVALFMVSGDAAGTAGSLMYLPAAGSVVPHVLLSDLRKPMDLAVRVDDDGVMTVLLSDAGSPPSVQRAVLGRDPNGLLAVTSQSVLVSTDLQQPDGVATMDGLVYWADSSKNTIEVASAVDGSGRFTLLRTA